MDVPELVNNNEVVLLPNSLFQSSTNNVVSGGWFKNEDTTANGIFDTSGNPNPTAPPNPWATPPTENPNNSIRNYRTYDFSANLLKEEPTNIILASKYTQNGGFTKERSFSFRIIILLSIYYS